MDNSQEMIKVCIEKTVYHETKHIIPLWFNLEQQAFEGKFDVGYNQMVLHHIIDYEAIIHTFYSLLNPEGIWPLLIYIRKMARFMAPALKSI